MKIKVIASTKVGYKMPKEEAIDFSGKEAGICYLPDDLEKLFGEDKEKTLKIHCIPHYCCWRKYAN